MATLYGKGRGRAGSHPPKAEKPYWLKLKASEIEDIVVKLAKEGLSSAAIGLVLRDSYGVPSIKVATGKKVQQILKEHNIPIQAETLPLEKKLERIKKHFEKNKQDMTAKRGLQLTESKLTRLKRYLEKK